MKGGSTWYTFPKISLSSHCFFARADRSSIFFNVQRYCGSTLATCYQRHNLQYRYYNLYNTRRLLDNGFKHFCNLKKLKYWFEKQKFTSCDSYISKYSYTGTKRCVPHCFGVTLGCQNSVDCSHKRSWKVKIIIITMRVYCEIQTAEKLLDVRNLYRHFLQETVSRDLCSLIRLPIWTID